jgi:hypothetical protein
MRQYYVVDAANASSIKRFLIIIRFYIINPMCYLPVKCLKAIVFIGSICAIAISIGLLARKNNTVTIYVQVEKK